MAFFVTFYSYKGGVGRTLTLANVAYTLATRGRRVVVVDMDLEAPGLGSFTELQNPGRPKKGMVDYATYYRERGKCPPLSSYVFGCRASPGPGEIRVFAAGEPNAQYQRKLGALAWGRLHERRGTEPFIQELRQSLAVTFQPDYVLIDSRTGLSDIGGLSTHWLADMVVLVSSLTRECLEGSARAFQSFTSPDSKIRGVLLMASMVPPGIDPLIVKKRLDMANDKMGTGRKILQVHYDPAMALTDKLTVRWGDQFPASKVYEELTESIQESHPEDVFGVMKSVRRLRSAGDSTKATELLRVSLARESLSSGEALEIGDALLELGQMQDAVKAFTRGRSAAPEHPLPNRRLGEALAAAGSAQEAITVLRKAEKLGAKDRELYSALARAYSLVGQPIHEAEARRKAFLALLPGERVEPGADSLDEMRENFVRILKGRRSPFPNFSPSYFWALVMRSFSLALADKRRTLEILLSGSLTPGDISSLEAQLLEEEKKWLETLGSKGVGLQERISSGVDPLDTAALLALRTGGAEDAVLLHFAAMRSEVTNSQRLEMLEEAARLDPPDPAIWMTLGQTLFRLAGEDPDTQAEPAVERAIYAFEKTCQLLPLEANGFYRLAIALEGLALLRKKPEKAALLEEAVANHRRALQLQPSYPEALTGWGNALVRLAEIASGKKMHRLFQQAVEHFKEALEQQASFSPALVGWSIALMYQAESAPEEERRQLLEEAIECSRKALAVRPGYFPGLSNLACALMLLGRADSQRSKALWEEAADVARQAAELDYSFGNYNLACAASRLGRFKEAQEALEKALARKPDILPNPLADEDLEPLWKAKPKLREKIAAANSEKTTWNAL